MSERTHIGVSIHNPRETLEIIAERLDLSALDLWAAIDSASVIIVQWNSIDYMVKGFNLIKSEKIKEVDGGLLYLFAQNQNEFDLISDISGNEAVLEWDCKKWRFRIRELFHKDSQ